MNKKRCSRCEELKPLSEFGKHKQSPDGLRRECKLCNNQRAKEWRDNNSEYASRINREYRTEHKDDLREYRSKWAKENRDKEREYDRIGRERHPEWFESYRKMWRKDNRKRYLAYKRTQQARRRAIKNKAEGDHTKNDVELIYKRQAGKCYWCLKCVDSNYHVDHRVPLSRGGTNNADNLVISCPKCNESKGAKLPHEWCGRLL